MAIKFYRTNEMYGCFSNFSKHGFEIDGKYWMTSEHYFQAMKFVGLEVFEKVRLAPTPMDAAKMGRDKKNPLREDWEDVKDDIMRKAVWSKFSQNREIARILIGTGEEVIIEKTSHDYYWGCGTNGTGKNMLGVILMEVRNKLQSSMS